MKNFLVIAAAFAFASSIRKVDCEPKITLRYFNIRGLGEVLRFTLSEIGLDFTNEAIDRDDWDDLKSDMTESGLLTFGQANCSEVYVPDLSKFCAASFFDIRRRRRKDRSCTIRCDSELSCAKVFFVRQERYREGSDRYCRRWSL